MLFAANIPLCEDSAERVKNFSGGLAEAVKKNRRPHYLYGTYEKMMGITPQALEPLRNACFDKYNPLTGFITKKSDLRKISELVEELKPYIDANYRTLANRANTLIAGSSMGGLISMFAAIKYPEVFSRVGVFSPAYWFSDSLFQFIKEKTISEPIRFYHISGANESASMVALMQRYDSLLATEGYAIADRKLVVKSDGAHSEWFWKREFPEAFTWLISGPVGMQAGLIAKLNNATTIYPNPVQTTLSIKAEHIIDSVQLIDKLGQVLFTKKLNSNYYKLETIDFAKGNYILLFHAAGVYYSRQITLE
jgi:metallo-beta-lactamase class B